MHIHPDSSSTAPGSVGPARLRQPSRAGGLTAAQHAAIRQQLVLIPVYIWLGYMWWMFFTQLPIGTAGSQTHAARDFVHFYAQGAITREHDARSLYDIDAMAAVVDRVVPVRVDVHFPPVYGPQVGLLFAPLAALPYLHALWMWLGMTIVGSAACAYVVWRTCPHLRNQRWTVAILTMAAPGLHFALSFGQVPLLGLLCFTALWLSLRADVPFMAGVAVGALAYKPQLGVVAACVFVWTREWRVVSGACLAILTQAIAPLAYWGPAIFRGYLKAITALPQVINGMEPDKSLMHSWRGLLLHLGVPSTMALALTMVVSLLTIAVAVHGWRRAGDLRLRFTLLIVATLLVDSHLYAYDLLLLTPALLVAWDWAEEHRRSTSDEPPVQVSAMRVQTAARPVLLFVYASPIVTIALPWLPIQWSVVGFVMLAGGIAFTLMHARFHDHDLRPTRIVHSLTLP